MGVWNFIRALIRTVYILGTIDALFFQRKKAIYEIYAQNIYQYSDTHITCSLCLNADLNAEKLVIYERTMPKTSKDQAVACPVKNGSLDILDGLVIHESTPNHSNRSRLAYTFHVMETDNVKSDSNNWLQLPKNMKFLDLSWKWTE